MEDQNPIFLPRLAPHLFYRDKCRPSSRRRRQTQKKPSSLYLTSTSSPSTSQVDQYRTYDSGLMEGHPTSDMSIREREMWNCDVSFMADMHMWLDVRIDDRVWEDWHGTLLEDPLFSKYVGREAMIANKRTMAEERHVARKEFKQQHLARLELEQQHRTRMGEMDKQHRARIYEMDKYELARMADHRRNAEEIHQLHLARMDNHQRKMDEEEKNHRARMDDINKQHLVSKADQSRKAEEKRKQHLVRMGEKDKCGVKEVNSVVSVTCYAVLFFITLVYFKLNRVVRSH